MFSFLRDMFKDNIKLVVLIRGEEKYRKLMIDVGVATPKKTVFHMDNSGIGNNCNVLVAIFDYHRDYLAFMKKLQSKGLNLKQIDETHDELVEFIK